MKRTSVNLPDELAAWLRYEADHRGKPVSDLICDALLAYRASQPRKLLAAGSGASGESDISERVEEILMNEWGGGDSDQRAPLDRDH